MRTCFRLIATVLLLVAAPPAVHAQGTSPRFKGDVGVTVAPLFKTYIDERSCCTPIGAWLTWGTGRFRLQTDYAYNRRRYTNHSGYYQEHQGQEIAVLRADLDDHVEHAGSAALYWRLSEGGRVTPHLLFGLAYLNRADRRCVAQGAPLQQMAARPHDPDELLYHVDFAPGEEERCLDEPPAITWNRWLPQAGLGFDVSIGSRLLVRTQVRAPLLDFRVGAGIRF